MRLVTNKIIVVIIVTEVECQIWHLSVSEDVGQSTVYIFSRCITHSSTVQCVCYVQFKEDSENRL